MTGKTWNAPIKINASTLPAIIALRQPSIARIRGSGNANRSSTARTSLINDHRVLSRLCVLRVVASMITRRVANQVIKMAETGRGDYLLLGSRELFAMQHTLLSAFDNLITGERGTLGADLGRPRINALAGRAESTRNSSYSHSPNGLYERRFRVLARSQSELFT
jgi:hypothetical protein